MPVHKKSAKKSKKPTKSKKSAAGESSTKGIGRKLAVYVPKSDEFVIDEIELLKETRQKAGYRTSLSYELIRLTKLGLLHKDARK